MSRRDRRKDFDRDCRYNERKLFPSATSNSKLKEVYQEIDKLEKTKLNVKEFSKREEEYQVFAWIAFFCILLELLLRNSVLKKIP